MNFKFENEKLYIEKNEYFRPELFFDCGQSFRFFEKNGCNRIGVAFGSVIEIAEKPEHYEISSFPPLQKEILTDFFDLNRNYEKIENELSGDIIMSKAMSFGRGIRILKQDFFETLLTFIYSQRSSIPRIAKCVEKTAELFGNEIIYNHKKFYAFPTPDKMRNINAADLAEIKCGYRSEYIIDAVNKVLSGEINYSELKNLSYIEVKRRLMSIKGVGEKVADCVCLFSFGFFEAFPTDTWIKKAMDSLYNISESNIKEASIDMFGSLSGIAQQYLFYYLRYNR